MCFYHFFIYMVYYVDYVHHAPDMNPMVSELFDELLNSVC